MEYIGTITGVGEAESRKNEILPKMDARKTYSLRGYKIGVVKGIELEFSAESSGNTITVQAGQIEAYGYNGYIDERVTFTHSVQTNQQYWFVYAEIDLGVVPNVFRIANYNNSNSPTKNDWIQDDLSVESLGKYQMPLWRYSIQNNSISELVDLRTYLTGVQKAETANKAIGDENGLNIVEGYARKTYTHVIQIWHSTIELRIYCVVHSENSDPFTVQTLSSWLYSKLGSKEYQASGTYYTTEFGACPVLSVGGDKSGRNFSITYTEPTEGRGYSGTVSPTNIFDTIF